jgi:hypothetical protein
MMQGSRDVHVGRIATRLEQREVQGVAAGEEGSTGETVAIASDPVAAAVRSDIEVVDLVDASRRKVGHHD